MRSIYVVFDSGFNPATSLHKSHFRGAITFKWAEKMHGILRFYVRYFVNRALNPHCSNLTLNHTQSFQMPFMFQHNYNFPTSITYEWISSSLEKARQIFNEILKSSLQNSEKKCSNQRNKNMYLYCKKYKRRLFQIKIMTFSPQNTHSESWF